MLVPKVSLSLNSKADKVTLTEETGIYVANNNETGWGIPNIDTDDVTESSVTIYDTEDSSLQVFILKDEDINLYDLAVSSPIPSPFIIISEEDWDYNDGIYKIVYEVSTLEQTYTNTCYELFLCKLSNCLKKLIVKLLNEYNNTKKKKLKDEADQIEIFIYSIKSTYSCGDFETALSILSKSTTYCNKISNCHCGC
jgi:hypothetical protein